MKKRLLSILMALALCLSLLPTVALAAEDGVKYLDDKGVEQIYTGSYTEITADNKPAGWTTGWYVVTGDVTIGTEENFQRVTVSGDVHLILMDDCTLTVNGGIQVQDNSTESTPNTNALTIYAQTQPVLDADGNVTNNVGKLIADAGGGNAGIGGGDIGGGGTVTINGGNVTAKGAGGGAGIGGGDIGSGGTITINGGTVTATCEGGGGAGIGGGDRGSGGGDRGSGGTITINGGTVTATCEGGGGAGIGGGGSGGSGGTITINGGTVTATGGGGAGIGGGNGGDTGTFQTNGGNAVIFASSIGNKSNQSSWSGIIFEGNKGKLYGTTVTPTEDFTIESGKTLTIDRGKTLIIPEGVTLTVEGGTLTNNGTIINFGTITGTVSGNTPKTVAAKYLDENGKEQTAFCDAAITAANPLATLGEAGKTTWYVVQGTVAINSRVTVIGDVYLILADGCKLTVEGNIRNISGEYCGSLTIYGQSNGTGKLAVTGGITGADGDSYGNGGNVIISGGMVEAATISGGSGSRDMQENCGTGGSVYIHGGAVTATGSISGGTGGGSQSGDGRRGGNGGNVIISGGMVKAATISGGMGGFSAFGLGPFGSFKTQEDGATSRGNAVIFANTIFDKSSQDSWSGVIFEGDEGKVYGSAVTPIEDFTIDSDKTLLIPENAELTIRKITAENNGTIYVDGTLSGMVDGDGSVYYPLTVKGGTASGDVSAYQSKNYGKAGSEITLTPNTPTGYAFSAWEVSSADAVAVADDTFTMPGAALTVTAQFSKIYYITYELNGGTINGDYDASYTYGQSVTLPTNVTKAGYTFAGWYDNETVTGDPVTEVSADDTGDKTFWAKWTKNSSGGGVSTYAITVESAENGTVTMTPKTASKGTTVTLTVKPDKGYTLETLTVTDKSGNEIDLTNKGDGKYTFKMPGSKVAVKATFMEDNSMLNFFVDVPADAYYYDAVLWAAENGITGGVDDTHFAPNAPCTRAQIVTFLWRAAGCPEPESLSSLSDVPADAYYAKAVAWALENGITTGTGDGTTFSPNATCTRAQAMTFIYRSVQARGGGMQGEWMFRNPFSDVDLESYYGEAVMWAVANGVTDGTTATTFSPNANCTRAQIVTFLFRCLGE